MTSSANVPGSEGISEAFQERRPRAKYRNGGGVRPRPSPRPTPARWWCSTLLSTGIGEPPRPHWTAAAHVSLRGGRKNQISGRMRVDGHMSVSVHMICGDPAGQSRPAAAGFGDVAIDTTGYPGLRGQHHRPRAELNGSHVSPRFVDRAFSSGPCCADVISRSSGAAYGRQRV